MFRQTVLRVIWSGGKHLVGTCCQIKERLKRAPYTFGSHSDVTVQSSPVKSHLTYKFILCLVIHLFLENAHGNLAAGQIQKGRPGLVCCKIQLPHLNLQGLFSAFYRLLLVIKRPENLPSRNRNVIWVAHEASVQFSAPPSFNAPKCGPCKKQ